MTVSKAFCGVCVWFCVCVCVSVCLSERWNRNGWNYDRQICLSTSPRPLINIRSKGQRSRSQGHKVQKGISGDRVARRRFALYWVATGQRLLISIVSIVDDVTDRCRPVIVRRKRCYGHTSDWFRVLVRVLGRPEERTLPWCGLSTDGTDRAAWLGYWGQRSAPTSSIPAVSD